MIPCEQCLVRSMCQNKSHLLCKVLHDWLMITKQTPMGETYYCDPDRREIFKEFFNCDNVVVYVARQYCLYKAYKANRIPDFKNADESRYFIRNPPSSGVFTYDHDIRWV